MIRLRIAEILSERGITKTQFAEMMGIKKQNVNSLLETNNIRKIEEIADKLGLKFSDLVVDSDFGQQPAVTGYIEFAGEIVKISSVEDIEMVLQQVR
ncbi:MAG: helix-turn-helix transcriptional regulator [Alistipes sp.]|nr:helix-turn-helix transcriptional regulator [Alistipes sp.]